MKIKLFLFLTLYSCFWGIGWGAQKKSDKIKPQWLYKTPVPTNDTYHFMVVFTDNGTDLISSRQLAKKELAHSVEREEQIAVSEIVDYTSEEQTRNQKVTEQSSTTYSLKIESEGKPVYINFIKVDEYWEDVYENGRHYFRLHTLFAVAKKDRTPRFDEMAFTTKYGLRGFARSLIVPGWGQIYKGNTTKGGLILGGEVILAGSIIVSENMRASYVKKMKEQPQHLKSYNSKADNWENIRNVCIGGAAALYVYSLIDAIAADGRKRVIPRKRKTHFSFQPFMEEGNNGFSFALNF